MNENPLVSVVITTKNEEKNIEACLQSIKEQTYPNIEIIVVDNFSTDATVKIARRYTEHVYQKGPERSAQRNYGMIEKAKGKYVMYVDADMVLSPSLVEEGVERFEKDKQLVGLYVPLRWVGSHWIIKARGFEREFYDGSVLDAVRFIKRSIFVDIGGFDVTLYAGEDWDLDKRIRAQGKVDCISSIMYHYEDENINLKTYIKKMKYYSPNLHHYIKKWGRNDPDFKKQFGVMYRYFIVFLEKGHWLKILRHPVRFFQMYFLKLLTGIIFVASRKGEKKSKNFKR